MIDGLKVVVVMPAYNAAQTLERTVAEVPALVDEIIQVDDGSADGTAEVAGGLGLQTLVHPKNRGYGSNQKTCYLAALERGAEIVVMVHPDYQYTPKLVPALAHCVSSGLYDVALGSRILGGESLKGGMPAYKVGRQPLLSEASSIGFAKSVRYGIGVLGAAAQFRLAHWGLAKPRFLSEQGRKLI